MTREELENELKEIKLSYRQAKRNLRKQHIADKKAIKNNLKELKPQTSFLERVSSSFDRAMLVYCKPFEERARLIRYKQEDPDGYEADMVVEATRKLVNRSAKRFKKKGEIGKKGIQELNLLLGACQIITSKNLGKRCDDASGLAGEIKELLGHTNPEKITEAMLGQLEELFAGLAK